MKTNFEQREKLALSGSVDTFRSVVKYLEDKYKPYHEGTVIWEPEAPESDYNMKLPPWICQPYFRASPEDHIQKLEVLQNIAKDPNTIKRQFFDLEGNTISRKKAKKLQKTLRKPKAGEKLNRHEELCLQDECLNTKGMKCQFLFCKTCCRNKCYADNLDCVGHQVMIKSKRENRIKLEAAKLESTSVLC